MHDLKQKLAIIVVLFIINSWCAVVTTAIAKHVIFCNVISHQLFQWWISLLHLYFFTWCLIHSECSNTACKSFLGGLFDSWRNTVVSNVRPYTYVHTFTGFFDFNDVWHVAMRDARRTVCSTTRSKVKVMSLSKLQIRPFSKAFSSAIYNGSWQLNTDS